MPGQRPHDEPDEATERYAQQVEKKNSGESADDFAFEFQRVS